MAKSVAVTGRRPESLPWGNDELDKRAVSLKNRLKYTISSLLEQGYTDYYVGMARGIDTYIAEILLELRLDYQDIRIFAVLPYEGFSDRWTRYDRDRFSYLISMADNVETMYKEPSKGALFARNKHMVDSADILLAVYDNIKNGGTYNTLLYAREQNKKIVIEEI